jgi:type IV secretory pathway VirD2 relaxase
MSDGMKATGNFKPERTEEQQNLTVFQEEFQFHEHWKVTLCQINWVQLMSQLANICFSASLYYDPDSYI